MTVRDIAHLYHPVDLDSGAPCSAERLASGLEACFDRIRGVARDAGLSESSKARVEKAARVVPKMVDTMRFFHDSLRQRIEAMELPTEQEKLMRSALIPAAYLSRVTGREDDADRRADLRETRQRLLAPLHEADGMLATFDDSARKRLEQAAFDCADLFQRSSSCVEGRNGRLAQWEHAQRRLRPEKLAGINVVHNYFIERPDGTTAAERFFGSKPRDLFQWLLDHVRHPPRPATSRRNPVAATLFQPC